MASASSRSTPVLVALLAALAGYALYTGAGVNMLGFDGLQSRKARVQAVEDSIAALQGQIDDAKAELAKGTAEDLRVRLEGYRASLGLMRLLVPEGSEVPNLLDAISGRAKVRGVNLSEVSPLPREDGPVPFATQKYGMAVIGRYDQVGRFMADVAGLERIIVPGNLTLSPAPQDKAKALGDTSGALLQAQFQVRTFVKSDTLPGGAGRDS